MIRISNNNNAWESSERGRRWASIFFENVITILQITCRARDGEEPCRARQASIDDLLTKISVLVVVAYFRDG